MLSEEEKEKVRKDFAKVDKVVGEFGLPTREIKDIIDNRFGGSDIFLAFSMLQLQIGSRCDKNLSEAIGKTSDQISIVAMIQGAVYLGYMIAEERCKSKFRLLEAKIIIAEAKIEKLK